MMDSVRVVPLDEDRLRDFWRVHCEDNGFEWCCCCAWWVPTWEEFKDRTAQENRAHRENLFQQGIFDGYLLYVDEEPVGWCQVYPRDKIEKLAKTIKQPSDPSVWVISCFCIAPNWRKRRLASVMLHSVLDGLRRRGIRRVEALPVKGVHEDGEVWTGPESIFVEAGFTPVGSESSAFILDLK